MYIILSTIDEADQIREFSTCYEKSEIAFDLLNAIVAKGHRLLRARLVDGSSRISLPLEAFDGLPCSDSIRALEQEWVAILAKPVQQELETNSLVMHFLGRQLESSRIRINRLEGIIQKTDQNLQRIQNSLYEKSRRTTIIDRFTYLIGRYQQQLAIEQCRYDRLASQLVQ